MTYLVSYENMGIAMVWIDDNIYGNITDINDNQKNVKIIDALQSERTSVNHVVNWLLLSDEISDWQNIYIHCKIIHSKDANRTKNKFKIINVKLFKAEL